MVNPATNTGPMTPDMLGKLVKGWAQSTVTVLDLDLAKFSPLEAAFPSPPLTIPRLEVYPTKGNPGVKDVDLSGKIEETSWKYQYKDKDITNKWDKYKYMILDSCTNFAAVNRMGQDGTNHAMRYFSALRTYKVIEEMRAKTRISANTSATLTDGHAAASATWGTNAQQVEEDILKGIEFIMKMTGIDPMNYRFGVIYPTRIMRALKELDLINMVQQTVQQYLSSTWPIDFFAFTPYIDADGQYFIDASKQTSSDILGPNALVFAESPYTMITGAYKPTDIMLSETWRVPEEGWATVVKQNFGALAVPMYDYQYFTTPMLYQIDNVITA